MPEFLFACWAGLKELKAEDAESSRKEGVGLSEVKQTITFVIRRELAPRLLGENLNVSYRGTLYTVKACSVKFDELFLNCEVRE
ncbi:hypothetical protein [Listeria fleischmannii]|nr:hypothetical protein [Listeria fleischmannii]EMG27072.1 hypothetical protein LFLEISCH_12995 [Listeria fleischmannii subsp. fleischmannii LU2006-1]